MLTLISALKTRQIFLVFGFETLNVKIVGGTLGVVDNIGLVVDITDDLWVIVVEWSDVTFLCVLVVPGVWVVDVVILWCVVVVKEVWVVDVVSWGVVLVVSVLWVVNVVRGVWEVEALSVVSLVELVVDNVVVPLSKSWNTLF